MLDSAEARDFRSGLRDIFPVMVAAFPIGLLFGALCVAKGLSVMEAGLMSILVFAGGAQFAAVEMWTYPVPLAALVFSTLLINSRHILMSASLTPKLKDFSLPQTLGAFFFLTDESWALAERRALRERVTPAYWFACAMMLPISWIGSTFLGAWLGSFLGDPHRIGADFAFTALFIGLTANFWKGGRTGMTIAASAIASAVAWKMIGPPWHVAAGAFAGILTAYLTASEDDA